MGATTSAAISCADTPASTGPRNWPREIARLTRIDRLYGTVLGWWLWAPCAAWPVRGQDNYRGPWNATTKNPILVIGTRHDPATVYRNAVRVSQRVGNARLLTLNGYGHVSFHDPSPCVDQARTAYLVDLITPTERHRLPADQAAVRSGIRQAQAPAQRQPVAAPASA